MRERTVLITGGSRGIGAASVRAFAEAGYRVAFSYHSHEAAARAREEELGGRARAFRADVADPAQVRRLFEECRSAFGPAEILICSAGIAQQKLFTDLTDQDWQRMLDVDLSGAFYCCRQALPDMIRARWGRILLVSSMWGQTGGSCEVHYSAAKAGLIGLGKALAEETPVGRLGSPEEMARTLLFLAGEESGYITGQVLGQNGGLVI